MVRSIPAQMKTDLAADEVTLFYAVELQFSGGTVRLWTGTDDLTIESNTFTGAGALLNISGLDEASDLSARGATITLSSLSSSIVSVALSEPYQGRNCRIWVGTEASGSFSQVEIFTGILDVMTISDDGQSATVAVTVESKLINLQRANVRRYTSENHKLRNPGDTFFDYVEKLQDKEIAWGRRIAGSSGRGSSQTGSEPGR